MADASDTRTIEARLARLECQHRRLKCAGVVAVIPVALVLLAPYSALVRGVLPKGRTVEAQAFMVVDADGTPRAALTAGQTDEASLAFYDKARLGRALLGVGPDGAPLLAFVDENDKLRESLSLEADGSPVFVLIDNEKHARAALRLDGQGTPILSLVESEREQFVQSSTGVPIAARGTDGHVNSDPLGVEDD